MASQNNTNNIQISSVDILSKTFDDLPIGIGIFHVEDVDDIKSIRYVFMNKVVLYEMRKDADEVIGKKIIEVAPEAFEHEGGVMVMETYQKIAKEGGSINLGLVEYSNHMVAGTYECSVHHIEENYVYVMLRNVTDLEQAKNELEVKNKELSQFAYIVSHDLKEPLRNFKNITEILRDDYKDVIDDEGNKLLNFISGGTNRMIQIINDLLDYGSVGKQKEITAINCNELVNIILQDLGSLIKDHKANIIVNNLPTINGYRTELRLLFQNLINNAIKFNKPGENPRVEISAEQKDGWTFSVKDNGIGISTENKDKVFNVFERLHSKSEYEGTGIGLAHCKKITDLHGGKIWIESDLGKGSTFYFNIPALK